MLSRFVIFCAKIMSWRIYIKTVRIAKQRSYEKMRYLILSLITFFIGIGFAGFGNSVEYCPRPIADIKVIENPSLVENVAEIKKEPRFKTTISCDDIKRRAKYAVKSRDRRYANGGVLNGKSCFVEPIYSKEAIEKSVSGEVNVEVLVDGLGTVRSAKAISGNKLLWKSAVEAAYKTQIAPTMLGGEFVNIKGLLIYDFVLPE